MSEGNDRSNVLDPETVRTLGALGPRAGESLLTSVARQFASSELLDELLAAASTGQIEAIRRAAHKLKGRSSMVGAGRLAELAGAIESSPAELADDEARTEEIRGEYRRVVAALWEAAGLGGDEGLQR